MEYEAGLLGSRVTAPGHGRLPRGHVTELTAIMTAIRPAAISTWTAKVCWREG